MKKLFLYLCDDSSAQESEDFKFKKLLRVDFTHWDNKVVTLKSEKWFYLSISLKNLNPHEVFY